MPEPPIEAASYRILVVVGFGIDRRAKSRKGRGLFRKAPDPREVGERLNRLVRRVIKDGTVRSGTKQDRFIIELRMFASAPLVTLTIEPDGELAVRGETSVLGPGYHTEILTLLAPLLEELDYVWTEPVPTLVETQRAMCGWLADALRAGPVRFGIPEGRRFRIDAPALTPLGPRDGRWRDAVLADAMQAADAFPWWERGPGCAERARALVLMWLEVPWREPLDKDERDLVQQVDDELRLARKADAALALPWHAWKELLAHQGVEDEEVNAKASGDAQPIGYRRHDLDLELSGGWSVTLPAAMVGRWENDGERYWATDGERAVEFSSLTADGETDSDQLLAVAPEKHAVIARYSEGAQRGRAEAFDDEDVHVVIGLMTQAPHVAILTIKGADDEWALATWRTLRQSG